MTLNDLRAGMMVWHENRPFRLLNLISKRGNEQRWKVQPLFVDTPERTLVIKKGDEFHEARFHTQHA